MANWKALANESIKGTKHEIYAKDSTGGVVTVGAAPAEIQPQAPAAIHQGPAIQGPRPNRTQSRPPAAPPPPDNVNDDDPETQHPRANRGRPRLRG